MWFTEIGQVTHEAAHLGDARHLDAAGAALMTGDPVMRAYDAELIWVG